ncbi:MAG: hypothetical protein HYY01_14170 [Chloroflexi bacterium]|nr:hypothetical protein [Chloroflexota bacterium]
MHDMVRLERMGKPAVVLVHDRFQVAARTQARIMGLPSAHIVVVPEGIPGESPEQLRAKIDRLWPQILQGLTTSSIP